MAKKVLKFPKTQAQMAEYQKKKSAGEYSFTGGKWYETETSSGSSFDPATYAKGKKYTKYFQKGGVWYGNVNGTWQTFDSKEEAKKANTGTTETETTETGTTETTEPTEETTTPEWLKNNEYWLKLSPDEQDYLVNYYNVLATQDEENQEILAQALEDAQAQADPYFAEQIRMAQDELTRAVGGQTGDFASRKRDLESRIEQLKDDLSTGTDRLDIDQQSQLARQQKSYESQLDNLVEDARHKGLTFSTKRELAESKLNAEQQDIVESTKRNFQRRIADLQRAASRGEVEAQNLLSDYERDYGENVTSLIRGSEQTIGTSNLPSFPDLPGIAPLGGVVGSLEENKQTDILQRAEALASLRNPFL